MIVEVCPMLDPLVTAATSALPCPSTDACLPLTHARTSAAAAGISLSVVCIQQFITPHNKLYASIFTQNLNSA